MRCSLPILKVHATRPLACTWHATVCLQSPKQTVQARVCLPQHMQQARRTCRPRSPAASMLLPTRPVPRSAENTLPLPGDGCASGPALPSPWLLLLRFTWSRGVSALGPGFVVRSPARAAALGLGDAEGSALASSATALPRCWPAQYGCKHFNLPLRCRHWRCAAACGLHALAMRIGTNALVWQR